MCVWDLVISQHIQDIHKSSSVKIFKKTRVDHLLLVQHAVNSEKCLPPQARKQKSIPATETEIHPSYPIPSRLKLGTISKFTAVSDPATLTNCSTLKASALRPQRTRLKMMCSNSPVDRCWRCSPRATVYRCKSVSIGSIQKNTLIVHAHGPILKSHRVFPS